MLRTPGDLHERHLRHLWHRQELLQTPLSTIDGHIVEVLHPGTLNSHAGPDFLHARIRIGNTLFAGDVEFHRHATDWTAHQHHLDPHYNAVILHVVLERDHTSASVYTESGRCVPNLFLESFLLPERTLAEEQGILDERARLSRSIPCADLNFSLSSELLLDCITRRAEERLDMKALRIAERIAVPTSSTLTQALYEGLMDGLGYARNRVPFMRLASEVSLDVLDRLGIIDTPLLTEALFFGAAGLLPSADSQQENVSRTYVQRLHEAWHALRHRYRGERLSVADWSFSPARPLNHPTRRIAQAAALSRVIIRDDLMVNLLLALASRAGAEDRCRRIRALLSISPSSYWQDHRNFDHAEYSSLGMIGTGRIDAMIINVVVPFGWMLARVPEYSALAEGALELWNTIPASSGNHITRLMGDHLLRGRVPCSHAFLEQGVLHLYHYYCRRERCGACPIGTALGLR
jgi:hypothetical protein